MKWKISNQPAFSKFSTSVCLQSLLPACLSPSLPCMCGSPAREAAAPLPSLPGRRRQEHRDFPEPFLHLEQSKGISLHPHYLLSTLPSSHPQSKVAVPSSGAVPASPLMPPPWASSREGDLLQSQAVKLPWTHICGRHEMKGHGEMRGEQTIGTCQDAEPVPRCLSHPKRSLSH